VQVVLIAPTLRASPEQTHERSRAMSNTPLFDIIMADPPWPYDSPRALVGNGGRGSDGGKAAAIIQADVEQHYDVMTVEQIKALPVARFASKDCLLFLWITNPFLAAGIGADVSRAWGFKPITVVTWAKIKRDVPLVAPSMKTGHWFRSASEHFIVASRGRVPRPADWPACPTWMPEGEVEGSPREPHSVKPDVFYERAAAAVPGGRYLELFARRQRSGWSVWGNEVDSDVQLSAAVS
jgi:N6-adenosine-specific RNA methylase IME4